VVVFKYPIEFVVDVTDAPDMKPWAEKVARACERAYPMINEELASDGLKPNHVIQVTLKNDYHYPRESIIYTRDSGGGPIVGSLEYFKAHPDDFGAMVHMTVYVVQGYGARQGPSWLVVEEIADSVRSLKYQLRKRVHLDLDQVPSSGGIWAPAAFLNCLTKGYDQEYARQVKRTPQWLESGIADYLRFFKYEPGNLGQLDPPDKVHYCSGYRQTASFLAHLTDNYDKQIVRKLNQIVREGKYREDVFETLTGKPVQELDKEWRAALRRHPAGR
jgi:hypothetical protein